MSYTAGDVMDAAAVLLNDTAKSLYSYTVQLPYLKIAQRDLEQRLQLVENQIDIISEAIISVAAGDIALSLPSAFFLPISLQERKAGDIYFSPMYEKPDINDLNMVSAESLNIWDFRHNCINFIAPTTPRQVRLKYWRTIAAIVDENSIEIISGAQNCLAFRTAALCSRFIGGNAGKDRAKDLNDEAKAAFDVLESLFIKNNQGKRVRRKPFRRAPTYLIVR